MKSQLRHWKASGYVESTNWTVFIEATDGLDEYTDTVTSYISFCKDDCISTKAWARYSNDRPWFSADLKQLCKEKEVAFKTGDRTKRPNTSWRKGSKQQSENTQTSGEATLLLITQCQSGKSSRRLSTTRWEELHLSWMTASSPMTWTSAIGDLKMQWTCLSSSQSSKIWTLKNSMPLLDRLQFAYRANRCLNDAVNLGLHYMLQHLNSTGTYTRVLFVDFSSAFNTLVPEILQVKLSQLSMPDPISWWIRDSCQIRNSSCSKKNTSGTWKLSTEVPQGCVLLPLLFSLYTNHSLQGTICEDPEVCEWHHCGWPHNQWWWVCLQKGSWAADVLV